MSDANVLFFADSMKGSAKRLIEVIENLVPAEQTEMYRSIHALSTRLGEPKDDITVAVLSPSNLTVLKELFSIQDQLQDIRIILIVPDHKKETIAKAHKFYPRFLTYADSDFKDVSAVLTRLLKNSYSKKSKHVS